MGTEDDKADFVDAVFWDADFGVADFVDSDFVDAEEFWKTVYPSKLTFSESFVVIFVGHEYLQRVM